MSEDQNPRYRRDCYVCIDVRSFIFGSLFLSVAVPPFLVRWASHKGKLCLIPFYDKTMSENHLLDRDLENWRWCEATHPNCRLFTTKVTEGFMYFAPSFLTATSQERGRTWNIISPALSVCLNDRTTRPMSSKFN